MKETTAVPYQYAVCIFLLIIGPTLTAMRKKDNYIEAWSEIARRHQCADEPSQRLCDGFGRDTSQENVSSRDC
jgi:hypothetical protein